MLANDLSRTKFATHPPLEKRVAATEQTRNVELKELRDWLRHDLQPLQREGESSPAPYRLHALIDMGRIKGALRAELEKKLWRTSSFVPLLNEPRYKEARPHCAWLVSGLNGDDVTLLEHWGQSNGDIVSAWIVSELPAHAMVNHLRGATYGYEENGTRNLMRFYDPLVTPILHRVADKKWRDWFFSPMIAWWYPLATPQEERWSRIAGGGESERDEAVPLVLSEELMEALVSDPFLYQLLNFAEQTCASSFESDCYGVRLAKVEALLEAAKREGLKAPSDLITYVLGLLEAPARAKEPRWQEAVRKAQIGKEPLKRYFGAEQTN